MDASFLAKYYRDELYPFQLIYRMLTCGGDDTQSAEARSLGVQFQSDSNVWVMHDYKRDSCQALKQKMLFSSSRLPDSLHMAYYREGERNLLCRKKELVFDMDITDFTRFCSCRGSKRLCANCWFQMQGASLILSHLLEHTLGYEKARCLWIFSGRKGLHCLVNQPNVMSLSDKERAQLNKRLSIPMADDKRLYSYIGGLDAEFLATVDRFFTEQALYAQDIFSLPATSDSFEAFCLTHLRLRHHSLYYLVKNAWEELSLTPSPSKKPRLAQTENLSVRKWHALLALESLSSSAKDKPSDFLKFRILYPMIDAAPLSLKHQIKLPFSVHAITRNIALPLGQEEIMGMNIESDPVRIDQLFKGPTYSPDALKKFNDGKRRLKEWI